MKSDRLEQQRLKKQGKQRKVTGWSNRILESKERKEKQLEVGMKAGVQRFDVTRKC